MSYIEVRGGRALTGHCRVQGSKNVALHLYAATLLLDGTSVIRNAPAITDTGVCAEIANNLGAATSFADGVYRVRNDAALGSDIDADLGRRIRPTACFAAAVLVRTGRVTFPMPGGDAFCDRPIDLHLRLMEQAGARVERRAGMVRATLPASGPRAFRASVDTPYGPSLGGTVTAIFLAALADGVTVLTDVSVEPEVTHTIALLREAGADISWYDDGRIEVVGVRQVRGISYQVPPDRLEAGTLAVAAAMTGGRIVLDDVRRADLTPGFLTATEKMGLAFVEQGGGLSVGVPEELVAVDIETAVHPGFPTDLQPQVTALLTRARGTARVHERIYRQRATHVQGLRAFGAKLDECGDEILVHGQATLTGADVTGPDIRCVTALLLAALAAESPSRVAGRYHLDRGYEALLPKLVDLNAEISEHAG